MRLCPGGGGGGLFLDRVELPPGMSVEGGPDRGGAEGAIHKAHEVMRPTRIKKCHSVDSTPPKDPEGEDKDAERGEDELNRRVFTVRKKIVQDTRRHINTRNVLM